MTTQPREPVRGNGPFSGIVSVMYALNEGVLIANPEGIVTTLNSAAQHLSGWTEAQAVGRPFREVLRLEGAERPDPFVIADEQEISRESALRLHLIRRDGGRRLIALHNAQQADDGALWRLFIFRDLLAEQRALEEAKRSAGILATAQRLAYLATWEWHVGQDRITLSDALLGLFGPGRPVRKSVDFFERVHPDDRTRVRSAVERALRGQESYDIVFRLMTEARGTRVVRAMADVLLEGNAVARLSGAIQDITEQRSLESRLAIADRMVSVGTLAAGVAHEINNPLAYVVANTSFAIDALRQQASVRDSPALTEALEALAAVREGSERIRIIVRDLKTFSRPPEDKGGPIDVRRAMESALTMAGNEIRHRARLVRDYEEVPLIEADESKLGQLFLNLVVNAAQAIPEGAMDRNEIRVVIRSRDERVSIEVRDTGSGIPPEVLPRIFDPFFSTKPVGVGTGLGLAVCHGIATSFGGEIEVESQYGKGSLFRVLIPATRQRAAKPGPTPPPAVEPARRSGRVYVIDDEPALTSAIRRALMNTYDIVAFNYAGDALSKLSGGDSCDVILCDLMMPRMTGMDFYEALAAARPDLAEKVVFLTGGAFTPRAREFLAQARNSRLEKPFDMSSLAGVVSLVLRTGVTPS
jgi:PAS domain S-box-containing protein